MTAVQIITGNRDSGKTGKILELYRSSGEGDGFISLKLMDGDLVTGYDLMRLSSGDRWALARRKEVLPLPWDELHVKGSFSFSGRGIGAADMIVDDLLDRSIEPVYMDEIGRLELKGGGFHGALQRLLGSGLPCYISVRKNCVQDVIRDYMIKEYMVTDLGGP